MRIDIRMVEEKCRCQRYAPFTYKDADSADATHGPYVSMVLSVMGPYLFDVL